MNTYTNLRVKSIDFWKKNKRKILIISIAVIAVCIINQVLKNMPKKVDPPSTTYTPHVSVITDEKVPEKFQEPIENIIDKYFNYCNNQEYENAYNCITDECKKAYYPNLDEFKAYVDYVFQGKKKIYNIQSYSIIDNKYVYSIRILDDILANGTTDGYYYYEEKFVLTEENGNFKLAIGEFIGESNPNIIIEDEYMIVKIVDKVVDYDTETYKIVITNKTDDKYIIIADGDQSNEIILNAGLREISPRNTVNQCYIAPGRFDVQDLVFEKFYDTGSTSTSITLGAIRILENYDYAVGTTEDVLNSAVKLYSLEIPLE